jgi:hypothetical protein
MVGEAVLRRAQHGFVFRAVSGAQGLAYSEFMSSPHHEGLTMNTEHPPRYGSLQEHAALVDAAKLRAAAMRKEAIDAFWAMLARSARDAWRTARRSAPASFVHPTRSKSSCPR